MKIKPFVFLILILTILITSCQLPISTQNNLEDISKNPSAYNNKKVSVEAVNKGGFYSDYNKLFRNNEYTYVLLEDKQGYRIDALLNVSDKIYVNKKYIATGTIKSLPLCECLVKDKFYLKRFTFSEGYVYNGEKDDVYISKWYKFIPTSQFNHSGGYDDLPNLNSYALPEICSGKKELGSPYTEYKVPSNSDLYWSREYKCGNETKQYYYLYVYNMKVV